MNRTVVSLLAFGSISTAALSAQNRPTAQEQAEMQAAQFLVGKWSYILPGRTGSAVWTKKGDTEYTVDGPTYPSNGKMVTEHHDCRKI